ncbi:uncharacterized protein LOC142776358 [Rhipicephalus microplus]|uniref:uncharacterized protein LOC142776358 n=1 Tax=Rhipicephalus microplus TaxID=6941 RepID=UPI003F6B29B4
MGLVVQSEFFLAQSNVAARLSELRCERKLPTPTMVKPKLGDKKCTFSRDSPALKAPVSTSLVASAHETEDGSHVLRILAFEEVFMDSQGVKAKPWNLANVRCLGDRWPQIQRASCDSLFDEDAKVTVRHNDHLLNACCLHAIRHQKVLLPRGVGRTHFYGARQPRARQKEHGMDAHLEVVGVGPRDSVQRLGDFACEPCIYFFWALFYLLAQAGNAKRLHLEALCVPSLSEASPMKSREDSCVPTAPVRSSSPQVVRPRSSTLSTPETPKRSPQENMKMEHTRCSSSRDEKPTEAGTEETSCRQSVFQRVNTPLRGRNKEGASQDESSSKRLRLDHGEVEDGPCDAEMAEGWD